MDLKKNTSSRAPFHLRRIALCLALATIGANPVHAQTSWTASGSGLWQTDANWSDNAPSSGDAVSIVNAGAKTVTIDNTTPSGNLSIGSLTVGTTSHAGITLELNNTASTFDVSGTMLVYGGFNVSGGNLIYRGTMRLENGAATMAAGSLVGFSTAAEMTVGTRNSGQTFTMSGGRIEANGGFYIGRFGNSVGSMVMTGGTLQTNLTNANYNLLVGNSSNSNDTGRASLEVSNTAVVNTLAVVVTQKVNAPGSTSSASLYVHDGGTLEFIKNTYLISVTNGATGILENGVISYKDHANGNIANANLAALTFVGDNAFRLNNASNSTSLASYTFDTGGAAEHKFQALQLTGAASTWTTTGTTTIGTSGEMRVFDAANASVNAVVENSGTIAVTDSRVTWQKNVTVDSTGSLSGNDGATLVFKGNLINQSTNTAEFDLAWAKVEFSGAGNHQFDLLGSAALERGAAGSVSENMGIGTLSIAVGNSVFLTGDAGINALYVGLLDLSAWDTSEPALLATLANALNLSGGINLYYDSTLAGNAYLNGEAYDLWGGGMLIASVPEPSTFALLAGVGVLWLVAMRRRNRATA